MIQQKYLSKRWLGVLSILIIVIISYVDRMNVSVLITDHDFLTHFGIEKNKIAQGELMTFFLVGYGIAAFFLTPFYEAVLGTRKGFIISIFTWALFTILSPVASNLFLLLAVRTILGLGEGPLFSLKTMYIREHFNPNEFGKPNAISSMGVSIGLAVGFPIVSYTIYYFSWQSSYYLLGLLNLLIGLPLIFLFIQGKERDPYFRERGIKATKNIKDLKETMILSLKTPGLIWILIIEVATLSYLWGSSSWLPSYLLQEKHFSIKQMGIIASIPFIISIGSGFLGGYLIDRISKSKILMLFVIGGIGTSACVMATIFSNNLYIEAFGFIFANAFWGIQGPAIPTLVQILSNNKSVGSTYGIINGIGNLISAFMPTIMGAVIGGFGNNFKAGFSLLIGAQVITALCGLLFFIYKRDLLESRKEQGANLKLNM